jgi:hypothetical protein
MWKAMWMRVEGHMDASGGQRRSGSVSHLAQQTLSAHLGTQALRLRPLTI